MFLLARNCLARMASLWRPALYTALTTTPLTLADHPLEDHTTDSRGSRPPSPMLLSTETQETTQTWRLGSDLEILWIATKSGDAKRLAALTMTTRDDALPPNFPARAVPAVAATHTLPTDKAPEPALPLLAAPQLDPQVDTTALVAAQPLFASLACLRRKTKPRHLR